MSKIESLTPEQTAMLEVYKEKWIKIGLSTEPANFEECKKYAIMAYEAVDLPPPKEFYMTDSPVSALKLIKELNPDADDHSELNNMAYGCHDAGWLSLYDFMINEVKVANCEKLAGLIGLAHHCGWWSPYKEVVIFQHRPTEIHMSEDNLAHNESGPAILYADGLAVYAINGVRLTEQIVMRPETLTVEQIESQTDQDVKSIMVERFGWIRYIKESNAKLIDNRDNYIENTKEALFSTNNGNRLVVTCPTGRIFSLGVPDNISDCASAQKWLGNESNQSDEAVNIIART